MFEALQKKWKVSTGRLVLILITFALGGSATGYAGRKILTAVSTGNRVADVILYVVIVTILWPFMVLLVSLPFGQFTFFKKYIGRMISRASRKKEAAKPTGLNTVAEMRTAESREQTDEKRIVVFASGAGSNAQKIIDHFRHSPVRIALVVCNKAGAGVIRIAEKEGIPFLLINKEQFYRGDAYLPVLRELGTDLIVLAGFLWKVPVELVQAYPRKIVNIHPALLPKYGGKGMFGAFVHEQVIAAGEVQTGITIHYVDEHYDEGDIIFQAACPVLPDDDPQKLAQRIHLLEHAHYPRVVEELLRKS